MSLLDFYCWFRAPCRYGLLLFLLGCLREFNALIADFIFANVVVICVYVGFLVVCFATRNWLFGL